MFNVLACCILSSYLFFSEKVNFDELSLPELYKMSVSLVFKAFILIRVSCSRDVFLFGHFIG